MTDINREALAEVLREHYPRFQFCGGCNATWSSNSDFRSHQAEVVIAHLATLPVEPEVEWEYMGGPGVTYLRTKAVPAGPWEVVPNE